MKTKVLHLISQAHLDPVWLWPTQDGMAEALCTLQSAVDRCHEFTACKDSLAAPLRNKPTIWPMLFNLHPSCCWTAPTLAQRVGRELTLSNPHEYIRNIYHQHR